MTAQLNPIDRWVITRCLREGSAITRITNPGWTITSAKQLSQQKIFQFAPSLQLGNTCDVHSTIQRKCEINEILHSIWNMEDNIHASYIVLFLGWNNPFLSDNLKNNLLFSARRETIYLFWAKWETFYFHIFLNPPPPDIKWSAPNSQQLKHSSLQYHILNLLKGNRCTYTWLDKYVYFHHIFSTALPGSIHGLRVMHVEDVYNGANVSHWNTFVSEWGICSLNRNNCGKLVCNNETKCDKNSGRPKNVQCVTLSQQIPSSKKKNMAIFPMDILIIAILFGQISSISRVHIFHNTVGSCISPCISSWTLLLDPRYRSGR